MSPEMKIAFGKLSDLAVKNLESILNGEMEEAKPSDILRAAEIALDRHLGKPVQSIEAEVSDLRPITFAPVLGKLVGTDKQAD